MTKAPRTFAEIIFGSPAVNSLFALHTATFLFFAYTWKGFSAREWCILSPEQLMSGRIWTLITSGFMLGVFIFARIVENQLGFKKTMFVYFGSLVISMATATFLYAAVMHKQTAIIGASGAVMGLIAAAMLLDPFNVTYEMILPVPVIIKGWMFLYADVQGFLGGEGDGVSHLAHICGFFSVMIIVYFLSHRDKQQMRAGLIVNMVFLLAYFLLRQWVVIRNAA